MQYACLKDLRVHSYSMDIYLYINLYILVYFLTVFFKCSIIVFRGTDLYPHVQYRISTYEGEV